MQAHRKTLLTPQPLTSHWKVACFVLFRFLTDWMRPAYILEGKSTLLSLFI